MLKDLSFVVGGLRLALIVAFTHGLLDSLPHSRFQIQSVHGECWVRGPSARRVSVSPRALSPQVCVSLTPWGRDSVVNMLAEIQIKSLKHPSGSARVARDNLFLCRKQIGALNFFA